MKKLLLLIIIILGLSVKAQTKKVQHHCSCDTVYRYDRNGKLIKIVMMTKKAKHE